MEEPCRAGRGKGCMEGGQRIGSHRPADGSEGYGLPVLMKPALLKSNEMSNPLVFFSTSPIKSLLRSTPTCRTVGGRVAQWRRAPLPSGSVRLTLTN